MRCLSTFNYIWLHTHSIIITDISPDLGELAESLAIVWRWRRRRRRRQQQIAIVAFVSIVIVVAVIVAVSVAAAVATFS